MTNNNNALLANVFQMVTQTLAQNQQTLNEADDQNHDHGDNMVKTFQTITNSLQSKKNSPDSTALAYAAQKLSKEAASGSGKLYAQGLSQAAQEFKGKQVDPQSAVQLLQTLLGGGQTQQEAQPTDLLGSLLGGFLGNQQPQQEASQQPAGNDILGSLLGGLTGTGASNTPASSNDNSTVAANGFDMGDLVNAGMAYFQAKQSGGSNASALLQAVLAGSGMGNSSHRTQSTQLVANSFLQALQAFGGKS